MTEVELLESAPERIARHRQADGEVRVVDGEGKPVAGARVQVEQVRHAFLFGCNAFPVLHCDDAEKEATYQREFAALFNYATLGFYWGGYEPEPGRTREAQLREQAQWCQRRGIAVKGHPLVWHEVYPKWGPSDPDETRGKLHARVTEIVSGFAGLVDRWDVVNEATVSHQFENGVGRWAKRDGAAALVGEALRWARAANSEATLLYNDYNIWPPELPCAELVAQLVQANEPVDALGLQSHMHSGERPLPLFWEVCETYARFGKPLHFTETTVLSGEHGWMLPGPWRTTPEGEARQAEYVGKLYTLLFSHAAVEAITWWDFNDGQWQGAPAGLVREDLTPKPAYERLLELVKGEWWTRQQARTDDAGAARFRGYLGHYRVTVTTPSASVTEEVGLAKGAQAHTIVLR